MNYTNVQPTWQMKHGINTEVHAKAKYNELTKTIHKNYTCKEPGMTIMLDYPYISVMLDLEIDCLYHGRGLVEIKCPASINHQIPNAKNYNHIAEIDGELSLKKIVNIITKFKGKWQ